MAKTQNFDIEIEDIRIFLFLSFFEKERQVKEQREEEKENPK